MKASIIIPNLNGEEWIEDCIESCINQDFEGEYEIIVVDNGSTDRSLEILNELSPSFPALRVIKNRENTGFAHAVNQGIQRSGAEYVVLFNNDAFAEPGWLSALVETADGDKEMFSVAGLMVQHFDRELADDAGDYVPLFGWTCKRGDGLSRDRYTEPGRIFSACGGAALYRRSLFEEVGLFDESFFAYGEDVDIGWRADNLGYRNMYNPRAVCYHICSATTGGRYNSFKAEKSGQNTLLLLYKNMPWPVLILNSPFIARGFVLKYLVYLGKGYGKDLLRGTKKGFSMLKDTEKIKFTPSTWPGCLWCEGQMIKNTFVYIAYRLRRALGIK